jgi:two-component system, cell cycle response regulator
MTPIKTVTVCLLGISPRDERMIQIVLARQPSKVFSYTLTSDSATAEVALVNTDLEGSVAAYMASRQSNPELVAIYLSENGLAGEGLYRIAHRSLLFQLVLTLEDIAATMTGSNRRSAIENINASKTATPAPTAPIAVAVAPAVLNSPSHYPQLAAAKAPLPTDSPSDRAFEVGIETMGMFNMAPISALIVDDSVTVRNQLQAALQKAGVSADLASTGQQALLMLSKQTYDLIFLDVVMPGDDGYVVCKTIRKIPGNKQTQIMMLTSRSSPFDRARGALAGCDMYLIKPIDLKTFYAAVDRTIMKVCKNDRKVAASRGYQLSV